MAKTFLQMAEEAMARASSISPEAAIRELGDNPNTLLVDVRDMDEIAATGLGVGAILLSRGLGSQSADRDGVRGCGLCRRRNAGTPRSRSRD
jgi:hypothetical protein